MLCFSDTRSHAQPRLTRVPHGDRGASILQDFIALLSI